jgi:large subunit ribosomal protein L22
VLELIRGKDVNRALATLQFTRKSVARDIAKVLRSAIANAQQKDGFGGDVERLFVSACYANQGPSQKRVRPAPMGRAFRVVKRTAHLTVQVPSGPRRSWRGARGAARRARAKSRARARRRREEARRAAKRGARSAPRSEGEKRRRRRPWVRKFTRTDSGSASTRRGGRAGTRTATTRSCCTRICAARRPEEALRARRRLEDRDRARGQQAEDRHLHLAPGHHHRPQGTEVDKLKQEIQKRPTARSSSTSRRSRSRSSTRS